MLDVHFDGAGNVMILEEEGMRSSGRNGEVRCEM